MTFAATGHVHWPLYTPKCVSLFTNKEVTSYNTYVVFVIL